MNKLIFVVLAALLMYTRFIGIDWGLPYPMHPDERNMSVAVQQLSCHLSDFSYQSTKECLNPHFFAYGQFPLYLAYAFIQLWHAVVGRVAEAIQFEEATLILRLISAASSILNVFVILKVVNLFYNRNSKFPSASLRAGKIQNSESETKVKNTPYSILYTPYWIFATLIFVPYAIQFAHFGTTETLLMLLYTLSVYLSLEISVNRLTERKNILLLAFVSGLAIGTKVSSVIFCVLPLGVLLYSKITNDESPMTHRFLGFLKATAGYLVLTAIFVILFSPHNIINWHDFVSSMQYETGVGTGTTKVFYTRQFEQTIPVFFQLHKIFPYTLGWPLYILSLLGFVFLSWKDKKINTLRFAFIVYFLPTAFLYAKWTRFMAPILPIFSIFGVLALISITEFISRIITQILKFKIQNSKLQFKIENLLLITVTIISIIPGIAYLSIYQNPDVRFTASEWIYKNIPEGSYILSETANVVDIPLYSPNYQSPITNYNVISFDFYNLDTDPTLQGALQDHLFRADYIFIPSRRLFSNNIEQYPKLARYYSKLFSGELGFYKVAEFTSFPKISLFGKTIVEFTDETAEETWTVFDHPVIRIYRKT